MILALIEDIVPSLTSSYGHILEKRTWIDSKQVCYDMPLDSIFF